MSGAYAKEFEKWLESKRDEISKSNSNDLDLSQIGDSEDEVDNAYEFQSAVLGGSQGITVDAAPILSDDEDNDGDYDDDIRSEVEHCYEEEPPILEPVPSMPNQKQPNKPSASDESPVKSVRSVTKANAHLMPPGVDTSLQKDSSGKEKRRSEIGKKVFNCGDVQKVDDELLKQSGNIFDKFNAISEQSDDIPPPLIPSPEALFTDASSNSGDENFNVKISDNSPPDFCAMEADSTSEIFNANLDDSHIRKKEKNALRSSHGDVSIECDSTCMLGASPSVVSSGFASILEVDDAGNQQDCQGASRESNDISNEESYAETRPNESHLNRCSGVQAKEEDKKACPWDQECPTLEAAINEEERKIRENHRDILAEGPPVLSVIVQESTFQSVRRKRHTIDTVENISSSAKRKYDMTSLPLKSDRPVDVDSLEPPHLPRQADAEDFSSSQHNSKKLSKKKQTDSSKKNHCMKSKGRCRSHSLVVDLNKFVKRTSRLSHLQCKMHRLVSLLFPQIKHELKSMSPESIHFENVLVDLASSLHESMDVNDDSDFCCQKNRDEDCVGPSKKSSACAQNSNSVCFGINNSQSTCFSSCSSSCHHKDTTFVSSKHSTVSNVSPCPVSGDRISDEPSVSESMIPQLSQLSLTSERDKILKRQPSVLIKADVSEALRSFSKLACHVLQVLLPDLTISLFDALGDSYQDLVNLIDSVILSNSS